MSSLISALAKPSVTNEPPSKEEQRRNDITIIAWFLFALFLGFGIHNNALSDSRSAVVNDDLPPFVYPAGWITRQTDDGTFVAKNPQSGSSFSSQVSMTAHQGNDNNLSTARTTHSLRRSQELDRYRELSARSVTVLGDTPAVLVTYSYIADPTRSIGAIGAPVVVRGQDLLFIQDGGLVVVSVAADDRNWEAEQRYFDIVFNSFELQEGEQ